MEELRRELQDLVRKYQINMEQLSDEEIQGKYAKAFSSLKKEIKQKAAEILMKSAGIDNPSHVHQNDAIAFRLAAYDIKGFLNKILFVYYEPELLIGFLDYFKRSYERNRESMSAIDFPVEIEKEEEKEWAQKDHLK